MAYIDQMQFIRYIKMDTMDDVDNITKNIVREISRECKFKGITVDDGFCIYFVQLLELDPKWGISSESQLNRENISKLVNYCIEKLIQLSSPYQKNCMSQHLWMSQPPTRKQIVFKFRRSLQDTLQPLLNDILNFKYGDMKPLTTKLMKKILVYIILASGLGHPRNQLIMVETTHALGSVFKSDCMVAFCQLNKIEKAAELDKLTNLVCGIRLLNEKMEKTKVGFLQFHNSLREAIDATHRGATINLNVVKERVTVLTKIIERFYQLGENASGMYILRCTKKEIDFDPLYISYLIAYRQQEIFLRQMLIDIETIKHNTELLIENDFENICTELIKILKFQVNIPSTVVYPLFTELAQIHWKIQDEAILLENCNQILSGLIKLMQEMNYDCNFFKKLVKGVDANDRSIYKSKCTLYKSKCTLYKKKVINPNLYVINPKVMNPNKVLNKQDKTSKKTKLGLKIKSYDDKCKVLGYVGKSTIQFEYLGFCPWVMVQTDGGLIPGNPDLGIVKYKTKAYIFSCIEGAKAFTTDPERYIMHILDIARTRTDLVHLLQIHQQLLTVKDIPVLYKKPVKVITMDDVGVQTEVHPIASNIDRNYRWNTWDMYKDAVRYANIGKCKTRSTQTLRTSFKHPVQVQTIEYRSKKMQTKSNNYTNVPTLSNFLFGLRGRTDDIQHIIDLTTPIEE